MLLGGYIAKPKCSWVSHRQDRSHAPLPLSRQIFFVTSSLAGFGRPLIDPNYAACINDPRGLEYRLLSNNEFREALSLAQNAARAIWRDDIQPLQTRVQDLERLLRDETEKREKAEADLEAERQRAEQALQAIRVSAPALDPNAPTVDEEEEEEAKKLGTSSPAVLKA